MVKKDDSSENLATENESQMIEDNRSKNHRQLLDRRHNVLSSSNILFYEHTGQELLIERAEGQYLFHENGDRYLDLINNVAHVGHCHPAVTAAVTKQMQMQYTNSRYLNPRIVEYSERLLSKFDSSLNCVMFCNSGSEATDLALRLSRYYTGKTDFICLTGGYHGHVQTALDVSPYKWKGKAVGKPDHVHVANAPDAFRGCYTGADAGKEYANEVKDIIKNNKGKVAAFIAESLMSCAGQIIPPSDYFGRIREHCSEEDVLYIADEVQVGFGRVGTSMWAFEKFNVVPDIVTIGKPIANGFPIAAVVTRREIAESYWKSGSQYFNTFGGNAVACSAANAVLDVIENEDLMEKAKNVGNYILDEIVKIKSKYSKISDVRGAGLFIGIELLDENRRPDSELAYKIRNTLMEKRIIISVDGPDENVLKMKPPMCLNIQNAEIVCRAIDSVFQDL